MCHQEHQLLLEGHGGRLATLVEIILLKLAVLFVSSLDMPLLFGTTLFKHPKKSDHIEQEDPLAVNKCIPGPEAGRVQGVHCGNIYCNGQL